MRRPFQWTAAIVVLLAAAAAGLWLHPPELVRVGASYTAKIVCSNVFIAGRDPAEVLALDVQAPGHPLLKLMRVAVDRDHQLVRARLLGFAGAGLAVYREGLGCAVVPDGQFARVVGSAAPRPPPPPLAPAPWPQGEEVAAPAPALAALLSDPALTGPGMRAVVVVHHGRIVAERYAPGFTERTPLLGWSMTKTVTAALVGTLVQEGRLSLSETGLFAAWKSDERARIALADLLSMSSGLRFGEEYGAVTDVTRMLYLESDMARFAASQPLERPVGATFSYSSGTAVLLSRLWQDALPDRAVALDHPRRALFDPLGMRSAVLEADARGTMVGSSYLYATARDWARFGQLLLQDGAWEGRALLPPGFVAMMHSPARTAPDKYGQGQVWLQGPDGDSPAGTHPDQGFALPKGTYWLEGHDGQSLAIAPTKELLVVRLGLTPARFGYKPQRLVEAVARALP